MHESGFWRNSGSAAERSFGRRLLGLKFNASIALTSPLNLPAPGRRQPIYLTFRFCIDLCFC